MDNFSGSFLVFWICLTDMVATVADLTNQTLASEAGPDSFSFLPILDNPDAKPLRQSTIHHSVDGTFAIRKGKWKFVDSNGSGGWAMKTEEPAPEAGQLYDMEANSEETTNLYRKYPEVVRQLKALLEE